MTLSNYNIFSGQAPYLLHLPYKANYLRGTQYIDQSRFHLSVEGLRGALDTNGRTSQLVLRNR